MIEVSESSRYVPEHLARVRRIGMSSERAERERGAKEYDSHRETVRQKTVRTHTYFRRSFRRESSGSARVSRVALFHEKSRNAISHGWISIYCHSA